MSIHFGQWRFDGAETSIGLSYPSDAAISAYAPDGRGSYCADGVSMKHFAFHTSSKSRGQLQPFVSPGGTVLCWDGRLDNGDELVRALGGAVEVGGTDAKIVAAAYSAWKTEALPRLIGDWALVIWNMNERVLLLAKDFLGCRPLFYSMDGESASWSTSLDLMINAWKATHLLCEEYVAGFLAQAPAADLTPYREIRSVPPASYVLIRPGQARAARYWSFDPTIRIRYRNDADYEEHFRSLFAQSVCRRLHSDSPVLAELSGGMDSSSIVSMADQSIMQGQATVPRLDTVSYFNDREPGWNERPFFETVEKHRGRVGCHIDVGSLENLFSVEAHDFQAVPGNGNVGTKAARVLAALMNSQGHRVMLSGIGGDEVTGGVPTPIPELADLIVSLSWMELTSQLKIWAIARRTPWFHLLRDTLREFLPKAARSTVAPAWIRESFVQRHMRAFLSYEQRLRLWGALPSFQFSLSTLAGVQRTLALLSIKVLPPYEKRYPYLDRDLLEFLFAIPRNQMVRPGERRSLMRRALKGIVPAEILQRRRKAYVAREPLAAVASNWTAVEQLGTSMRAAALGIVDERKFMRNLCRAREGKEVAVVAILRTLELERWLRHLESKDFHFRRELRGPEPGENAAHGKAPLSDGEKRSICAD
jgi:asparagine synthase (glutamine-hydrolysing)